ncbi:MAG: hypothetical protein ACI9IO_002353 [Cyanobium sp.]|jgi:hypothetical protein
MGADQQLIGMSRYHQRVCGNRGRSSSCCGLLRLVHGESEQARCFYEHLIPEFERSPIDPLHLLLLKDLLHTLGS